MHPALESFAASLRLAQQSLEKAEADGDDDAAATFRERILVLEADMRAVQARLDVMAVQGWHFDISRDGEGFIFAIDAIPTPINL